MLVKLVWIAPHPPAGTFSPQAGRKGSGRCPILMWRSMGRQVLHPFLRPACGEKVPAGG